MIFVKRGKEPAIFSSSAIQAERDSVFQFYSRPAKAREQRRYKWRAITSFPEVRKAIIRLFSNKCAYCESLVGPNIVIDTFRPKNGAVGLDGIFDPDHYWWLAYEWSNLYLTCTQCNTAKANRFPINGSRSRIRATAQQISQEMYLLIDPCRDKPGEHLIFTEDGHVVSETQRGTITIEVLDLNRGFLVEERKNLLEDLRPLWVAIRNEYRQNSSMPSGYGIIAEQFTQKTKSYLGMRRQYLRQWAIDDEIPLQVIQEVARRRRLTRTEPRLESITESLTEAVAIKKPVEQLALDFELQSVAREVFSVEDEYHKENYYVKRRLIERVEISNFRIIEQLSIVLRAIPQEEIETPWLLLLGENGTGKSSILQAIALALSGEEHRRQLDIYPKDILRSGAVDGYIRIFLSGSAEPIELRFSRESEAFECSTRDPKTLLLGYGATRLPPRFSNFHDSSHRLVRAKNLFNPFEPLSDSIDWLSGLPESDFNRMALALKDLLLLQEQDTLVRSSNELMSVKLESSGISVPFRNLSDGYQSVVALSTDIMGTMSRRWPDMSIAEGIVLIDEIDAHLHPRWKMQIVKRLRQVFPRIQFILTSFWCKTLWTKHKRAGSERMSCCYWNGCSHMIRHCHLRHRRLGDLVQIMGDYAPTDPTFHPILAVVATASEAVAPFQPTDPP